MLQRANELAVQAANGTNSDSDRKAIQMEVDALKQEIDRISDTTSFNDLKLFQVDIKSNLQGINNSYSSLDIDALMKTFKVNGTPIDTTELTYDISADIKKGISINGTEIAWNNIQDINGNNLADTDIKGGTYTFIYNGSSISFDIENKTNIRDIATAIDNIEINLIPSYSYNRLKKATFESNRDYVKSGTHTFFANDYALGLKEPGATYGTYSKVWDRTLIYDTTSNVFEIQLSNTSGVYANLKLEFEEIPTREEIINAVDGITVDTYFDKIQYSGKSKMSEEIVDASTGTITYVERCTAGISRVNDEFCNEHGMDIYNQGYTFTLEGDDFAVPWKYTYNNKEYFLTSESEQKLDNITLNGGVSEGDVITLTFSNGVGEFDISYDIKQANVDARDAITIKGTNGYVGKMDIMTNIRPIYRFYNDVKLKEQKPDI